MAMSAGNARGPKSELNVTPLVDVVLVLLIIFMVIIPMTQVGYGVSTPPRADGPVPPPGAEQLIVRLDAGGEIFLNRERVPELELSRRLRAAITNRANRMVFFAAAGELPYDRVANVMDACRDAGARNIGVVFDDLDLGAGAARAPGMAR
jgi:biopolymer transport protein TolR